MRKNVASQHVGAQMNARADGAPLTTSVSVNVIKDGTSAAGGGTLTHTASGWWDYAPTQAETNAAHVAFQFVHASGVNVGVEVWPVAYDPGDAVRLGLTALPNAAAGASGGLPLSADASGRVDVLKVNGTSQTARDLGASVLLSSGTGTGQVSLTSGKVDVNDKTGFSLSSAGVQAVWDALTSALTTVGSIGKRIADFLTGDAFARLGAPAGASMSADIAAVKAETASIQADTNDIQTRLPAALVSGRMDASVGAVAANAITAASMAADAGAEIADAVWDEAISGHLTAGSTGNALNAAGSAGDPWSTPLPGAYGAGTAGKIIGDNINAPISGIPTAAANADAVFDEALSGHSSDGTLGQILKGDLKVFPVYNGSTTYFSVLDTEYPSFKIGDQFYVVAGTNVGVRGVISDIATTALPNRRTMTTTESVPSAFDSTSRIVRISGKYDLTHLDLLYTGINTISASFSGNNVTISSIAGLYADDRFIGALLVCKSYTTSNAILGMAHVLDFDGATGTFTCDHLPYGVTALVEVYLSPNAAISPTAIQNADALLDRADALGTGYTPRMAMKLSMAADGGKVDGAETSTVHVRNPGDTKNVVTATTDADGNRTAVTLDLT